MPARRLLVALAAALVVLPAAGAQAIPFGPNLATSTASNPYTCDFGGFGYNPDGCTAYDPLTTSMQSVLPDPIANGNQTGIVTDLHVLASANEPAQFAVVEWSSQVGAPQPFPSGVMAVSQNVTLHPGLNNFNSNLPVDSRLAPNGFETWSVVSLNILDNTDPIPGQSQGQFTELSLITNNGKPLTTTNPDLTAPGNNPSVSGYPPTRLLVSGNVTLTTPPHAGPTPPTTTPTPTPPALGAPAPTPPVAVPPGPLTTTACPGKLAKTNGKHKAKQKTRKHTKGKGCPKTTKHAKAKKKHKKRKGTKK